MSSKDGFKLHSVFMIVSIISLPCQVREQVALACTWRAATTEIGCKLHDHTRFCDQMRVNCPRLPLGPRLPTRVVLASGRSFLASSASKRVVKADLGSRVHRVWRLSRRVAKHRVSMSVRGGSVLGQRGMRAGRSACARNKKKAASPDGKKQ